MADYYSILNKTISGLAVNTPEVRSAVYEKARAAIEKQLRGMDPAPGENAIAAQLKLLEDAIVLIDAEHSTPDVLLDADPVIIETPAPATPEAPVAPTPPIETPSPAPVIEEPLAAQVETAAETINPVAMPLPPETVAPAPAAVAPAVVEPVVSAPQPAAPVATSEPAPVQDFSDPVAAYADEQLPPMQPTKPKRKLGALIGRIVTYLVIFIVLCGGGYALWLNRGELQKAASSIFADDTEQNQQQSSQSDGSLTQPAEKEPVRLGSNGEDKRVDPIATAPQGEGTTEVPLAVDNQPTTPATQPNAVEPVVDPTQSQNAETQNQQPGAIPIGEVAYLYEEGSAGAGATRTNAAVTWAIKRESLGEGLSPEPVILGKMDVPEKELTLNISIKRNIDEALSASHMVELRFDVPDNFSGGEINDIARFVMKATEEARGEPLVAVPVKVSKGYFLIALDNLKQAVEVNTQLLSEAGWIDIPISYATGKRALVTLEKGGTGERVFAEAFNDWKNR